MGYEYGDSKQPSTSTSTIPHKFFETYLDNDLEDLENFLHTRYRWMQEEDAKREGRPAPSPWDASGSITTIKWDQYNLFQFYHPAIHKLYKGLKTMVLDACDHYGLDFDEQQFYVQSWFNINYNHIGKLDWHEHGGEGAPVFHGYYCVKAEPSITHYRVFDKDIDNVNRNNRAILSETGHPHAMADWDWEGPRITIAYDVVPLKTVLEYNSKEQHYIPLV